MSLCIVFHSEESDTTVLALNRDRLDQIMALQVENRHSTVAKEAGKLRYLYRN